MQMVRINFTISSVAVKVQCLREKGKTVTPSWKSQAKGEIVCMTAVSLRLSCETSLVMRSEKRRMYSLAKGETLTLKTGKRHEYNAKNLSVTPV